MKGSIIYFSGTGNTKYIAQAFKSEFLNMSVEIDINSIEDDKEVNSEILDFIVVGFPIYADNAPQNFINWIEKKISNTNRNTKAIVFSTAASTGCGVSIVSEILENKGYDVRIQENFIMPNNYYFYFPFKETPKNKIDIILENSRKEVKEMVELFLKEEKFRDRFSKIRTSMIKVTTKLFDKYARKSDKKYTVNENCVKCGICVNNCPVNNIQLNEKIEFKHQCILCTRCIHICPYNAIDYKGKKVNQYNIHF